MMSEEEYQQLTTTSTSDGNGSGFELVQTISTQPPPTSIAMMMSANLPPPPPTALPSFFTSLPSPPSTANVPIGNNPFQPVTSRPNVESIVPIATPPANTDVGLDIHDEEQQEQEQKTPGMFGWLQKTVGESRFLSRVAEKAKSGMDAMITTLDPQMKEYMAASGSIEIAIASDTESIIASIKAGFQRAFQQVSGRGLGAPGISAAPYAPQPVGFVAGRQAALDRAQRLRHSGLVAESVVIIAVEHLLVEIENGQWFDFGCVLLDDAERHIQLHTFTQASPIPTDLIELLKHHTPVDYPRRGSGFAITTTQAVAELYTMAPSDDWHQWLVGVSCVDLTTNAAGALAHVYKQRRLMQTTGIDDDTPHQA